MDKMLLISHRSNLQYVGWKRDMAEPQRYNSPAAALNAAGGVFVGRRREMDELKAALDETLAGQGRLVMLAGEPGIGKTRTAQELAGMAASQGAQTLWGCAMRRQARRPTGPGSNPCELIYNRKTRSSYGRRWGQERPTSLRSSLRYAISCPAWSHPLL